MISTKQFIFLLLSFSAGFSLAFILLTPDSDDGYDAATDTGHVINPFSAVDRDTVDGRLQYLEQRIDQIEARFSAIEEQEAEDDDSQVSQQTTFPAPRQQQARRMIGSSINRRLFNVENLVKAGVAQGVAEDIVMRKNQVELRKLELQDLAHRQGYMDTQQYYNELTQIQSEDVDLRQELGDDLYDRYLFDSKQHNRVRITQVILGSEAERVGLINNDIVLSYDDKRVFTWEELKQATSSGTLGEYVNIVIDREGEIFSLAVPRGPLGVQLGYSRSDPRN